MHSWSVHKIYSPPFGDPHQGSCTQTCPTLCHPLYCSPPCPLTVGFFRQVYWIGLPFSPSQDLPKLGIKPTSLVGSSIVGRLHTCWAIKHFNIICAAVAVVLDVNSSILRFIFIGNMLNFYSLHNCFLFLLKNDICSQNFKKSKTCNGISLLEQSSAVFFDSE